MWMLMMDIRMVSSVGVGVRMIGSIRIHEMFSNRIDIGWHDGKMKKTWYSVTVLDFVLYINNDIQ
jgi:hypothetical protein